MTSARYPPQARERGTRGTPMDVCAHTPRTSSGLFGGSVSPMVCLMGRRHRRRALARSRVCSSLVEADGYGRCIRECPESLRRISKRPYVVPPEGDPTPAMSRRGAAGHRRSRATEGAGDTHATIPDRDANHSHRASCTPEPIGIYIGPFPQVKHLSATESCPARTGSNHHPRNGHYGPSGTFGPSPSRPGSVSLLKHIRLLSLLRRGTRLLVSSRQPT